MSESDQCLPKTTVRLLLEGMQWISRAVVIRASADPVLAPPCWSKHFPYIQFLQRWKHSRPHLPQVVLIPYPFRPERIHPFSRAQFPPASPANFDSSAALLVQSLLVIRSGWMFSQKPSHQKVRAKSHAPPLTRSPQLHPSCDRLGS